MRLNRSEFVQLVMLALICVRANGDEPITAPALQAPIVTSGESGSSNPLRSMSPASWSQQFSNGANVLRLPEVAESPQPLPAKPTVTMQAELKDALTSAAAASGALAADAPEELPGANPKIKRLPGPLGDDVLGDFPPLPPDPYADEKDALPPLDEELWHHGGAHLYVPEGDRRNWHDNGHSHHEVLRLPENWQKPKPLTAFEGFLDPGPIKDSPRLKWPWCGYAWEPRFAAFGSYSLFGFALEENNQRQDVVGHQLIADLDLRLTGTERFHVQFRPLGKEGTGGSYYQFSNPEGYVDNSTGTPDRYWFEGELHSMLGGLVNQFAVLDYHLTVGRIPLALHNDLLMNDELHALVLNKNTIYLGPLSNLNVQLICAFNDVSAFENSDACMYGTHLTADYHGQFWEATYAFVQHDFDSTRDTHFAAFSRTKLYGPLTLAMRAMFKWGDEGGTGAGQLFVAESNRTFLFDNQRFGIEKGVLFCNAFLAASGWNSIAGANFNRLRTSFEVNPLVQISAGRPSSDTWGAAIGMQLFRHHEDESIIPEFAFEAPDDEPVWGFGLRYLRKTSRRTFFEALGVINFSDDPRFDREGIFLSESILF